MSDKPEIVTDELPEKIHKSLHLTYFIVKMLLIGSIAFVAAQLAFLAVVVEDDAEEGGYGEEFAGHYYCGTFFIEQTAESIYGSVEAAKQAVAEVSAERDSPIAVLVIQGAMTAAMVVCLFLALRCGDKKTIFAHRASKYFLIAGALIAAVNIWLELEKYLSETALRKHYIGVFAEFRYYVQLYNVLAVPVICICCGLMLRQHERRVHGQSTKGNAAALRTAAVGSLIIAFGFMLIRFGVRAYELVSVLFGKQVRVRLPFYNMMLELPRGLAKTEGDYKGLVAFRFVKDLPVFAASAIAVILFARLLLSSARGEINTAANQKRLRISIWALIISSLLFNVLGLFEVDMLKNGFTGTYGYAVYTIGIRALCEPMLYALVLWFFSVYLRCVPFSGQQSEASDQS